MKTFAKKASCVEKLPIKSFYVHNKHADLNACFIHKIFMKIVIYTIWLLNLFSDQQFIVTRMSDILHGRGMDPAASTTSRLTEQLNQ